jgi:hypothetical protein
MRDLRPLSAAFVAQDREQLLPLDGGRLALAMHD